jgi:hypothetical protein
MSLQMPALRAQLEKYEAGPQVDSEEVNMLHQELAELKVRVNDLTELNEGLQKKLIGD